MELNIFMLPVSEQIHLSSYEYPINSIFEGSILSSLHWNVSVDTEKYVNIYI